MDLSLATVYAFNHLEVIFILDDVWSCILEWRQLGVRNISALPFIELEVDKFKSIKELL